MVDECRPALFISTSFYFKLFPEQALVFTRLQYRSFENTGGKGEIARNEQFLLFPQCFLSIGRTFFHFLSNLKLSFANSLIIKKESNICRLGKG